MRAGFCFFFSWIGGCENNWVICILKLLCLLSTCSCMSLIYWWNKRGTRTVPCGTLLSTLKLSEKISFNNTDCTRSYRKWLINFSADMSKPRLSSLMLGISWLIESNALERSRNAAVTNLFSFVSFMMNSYIIATIVHLFFLKPYWCLLKIRLTLK